MVYAEVRHYDGMLIEEANYFHEIPRRGDIIKYPYKQVKVMHSEHIMKNDRDRNDNHTQMVKVIVRWA